MAFCEDRVIAAYTTAVQNLLQVLPAQCTLCAGMQAHLGGKSHGGRFCCQARGGPTCSVDEGHLHVGCEHQQASIVACG